MTRGKQEGTRDPRFAVWIGATVVLFVVTFAVGFVWLPSAQRGTDVLDLWGVICRAVGLSSTNARDAASVIGQPASTVAWTVATRRLMTQGDAARGAAFATRCNTCHGDQGVSMDAAFPNLVGQSVAALYKQLEDFKGRKRNAAVMGVFVDPLSQQEMLDLAAYYASLPVPFAKYVDPAGSASPDAQRLVEVGSPMRNIAPCAACHGPLGATPGAPGLHGQQRAYLVEQLQAFKAGLRHNDISEQMRSVARQLTSDEIAKLADYYASVPSVIGR